MKKVILFDVDYTLLDSDVIKKETMEAIVKKCGVELVEVLQARDKYYNGLKSTSDINPDEMLGVIQKELRVPLVKLKEAYYSSEVYKSAIYPDVKDFLEKMDTNEFDLGIFSEGLEYFQNFKMEASGLSKYFNEKLVWVSRRKKSLDYIKTLPKEAIVVDDRLDVVKVLEKSGIVIPVWINRKTKESNPTIKTIFGLDELIAAATDGD